VSVEGISWRSTWPGPGRPRRGAVQRVQVRDHRRRQPRRTDGTGVFPSVAMLIRYTGAVGADGTHLPGTDWRPRASHSAIPKSSWPGSSGPAAARRTGIWSWAWSATTWVPG